MGASKLGIYLTGAEDAGKTQKSVLSSLGGHISASRAASYTADRVQPMPGLRIDHIGGYNGTGTGTITAPTAGTLTWTPPGGTAGSAVAVTVGTTAILLDSSGDKWIEVTRTGTGDLAGEEPVGVRETFNNIFGGENFSAAEAAAGEDKYHAVMLRNDDSVTMDAIIVWIDSTVTTAGGLAIAKETVDGDGKIQVIANCTTAPTGLTWVSPTTEGTALPIGTLTAGEKIGLWFRVTENAGAAANPIERVKMWVKFDEATTTTRTDAMAGMYSVAGTPQYELYVETTTPDPTSDTPRDTGATKPLTYTGSFAEGTYYAALYWRNDYGILSDPLAEPIYIDGAGESYLGPPEGPRNVVLTPIEGGKIRINAVYYREEDVLAERADYWRIYLTTNGVDPDPGTDTPAYEVALANASRALLQYDYTASTDNTEVRVIVRTVRDYGELTEIESTNVTVYSATATTLAPHRVQARLMRGTGYGQVFEPATAPAGVVEYTDQPNNIFFKFYGGRTEFWANTALVWALEYDGADTSDIYLYIPTEWDMINGAVAASGSTGTVETVSWTGGDKRISLNVNGSRRVMIDVTNTTITAESWATISSTLPTVVPTTGAWKRYADTLLPVWDKHREDYIPAARVNTTGLQTACNVQHTMTQAQIEAIWA